MNTLPKDLEEIIIDYKTEMETFEDFQKVVQDTNDYLCDEIFGDDHYGIYNMIEVICECRKKMIYNEVMDRINEINKAILFMVDNDNLEYRFYDKEGDANYNIDIRIFEYRGENLNPEDWHYDIYFFFDIPKDKMKFRKEKYKNVLNQTLNTRIMRFMSSHNDKHHTIAFNMFKGKEDLSFNIAYDIEKCVNSDCEED